ncbi:hypothetical protein Goari_011107 [Gossypium aridum]|uniref:Uncharacterized protein n=1 Tax=Gossypium aridum TaxID=34290 RepID=A0A7J8WWJ9_GOSAI|nr:hypothetical protein [Gossypium aridum]
MEANKSPLKCVVCCHCHANKESTSNIENGGSCPPPSSSSSSSTTSSLGVSDTSKPQQQLSHNKDDHQNHNNDVPHQPKAESGAASVEEDNKRINNVESQYNF